MQIFCENTALVKLDKIEIRPALLSIDQGFIQDLVEWNLPITDLPPATQILKNKLLTPAFVNAHTHLAMSFFRGVDLGAAAAGNMVADLFFKLESHLSANDVRAFARMGAYESLLCGVGTVWDHYYHGEAVAQALSDVGLTGVVASTLQDLSGPGKNTWEREWLNTETIRNSKSFAKQGIFAAWGPHATDTVSPVLWQKIHNDAVQTQTPVHAHLAQSREEFDASMFRHQLSPLGFLAKFGMFEADYSKVFAHGIYLHNDDMAKLSANPNLALVSCPFSQVIFDFPAQIMEWEKNKINWFIATDCVASNDSLNVQKELRYISGFPLQGLSYSKNYLDFIHHRKSTEQLSQERQSLWQGSQSFRDPSALLARVWQKPGAMHPKFKVGILAKKALANLVVWDLDHPSFWPANNLRSLCFADTTSAISNMMLVGKWLAKEGHFHSQILGSSQYKTALAEAKERLLCLLKVL